MRRYKINEMKNFNEMLSELSEIIFEPFRTNELLIKKVIAVSQF